MRIKFSKRIFTAQKRRLGSVILETALVMPLMLLLVLGIIQYGFIMNASNALTQIARESARNAALNPLNDTNIKLFVKAECAKTAINYNDITDAGVSISPSVPSNRVAGSLVTVSLTYPMSRKLFLPSSFFGISIFNSTVVKSGDYLIEGTVVTP